MISDTALDRLREALASEEAGGSRYEVYELIGEGGMGEVYRAHDRELDRDVALKVIRGRPGDAARLEREARILARLEHPGIVPVHGAGTLPDGRRFYAMKLVRGQRLDELVGRERPQLAERLTLFERLCETAAFAHSAGVVHRDLKPENVMVGPFGEVLVMDWGVAKLLESSAFRPAEPGAGGGAGEDSARSAETAHGTVLGTPGYMAPEQARGDAANADARADVYALGAILRFLLADLPKGNAGAGRLEAIAAKAMQEEPRDRYDRAAELAADVARFRAGLAVHAYPEALHERAARLLRRHKTPLLLVAAYVVMRALILLVTGR